MNSIVRKQEGIDLHLNEVDEWQDAVTSVVGLDPGAVRQTSPQKLFQLLHLRAKAILQILPTRSTQADMVQVKPDLPEPACKKGRPAFVSVPNGSFKGRACSR